MDLSEFKDQNPAYKDVPDEKLAPALYEKYYAEKMPQADFYKQINYSPEPDRTPFITPLKEQYSGINERVKQLSALPPPESTWEATKRVGKAALEVPNAIFAPLSAARQEMSHQMEKVPALAAHPDLPVEAAYPEMLASSGGQLSGQTIPSVPLSQSVPATLEFALINKYSQLLGGGIKLGGAQKEWEAAGDAPINMFAKAPPEFEEGMSRVPPARNPVLAEDQAAAMEQASKVGTNQGNLSVDLEKWQNRGITSITSQEQVNEMLNEIRGSGKSPEEMAKELNTLDDLMKVRYPEVGPFEHTEAPGQELVPRGPLGTRTDIPPAPIPEAVTQNAPREIRTQIPVSEVEDKATIPAHTGEKPGAELLPEEITKPKSFLKDESGTLKIPQRIPPKDELNKQIRNLVDTGMNGRQAIEQVASGLGRHPNTIWQRLQEAPIESHTRGVLEGMRDGAAANQKIASDATLAGVVESIVGKDPIKVKGLDVPDPVPFKWRVSNEPVIPTRDLRPGAATFIPPRIYAGRLMGIKNFVNEFTGSQITDYINRNRYLSLHSNIVKQFNLEEDIAATPKLLQRELQPHLKKARKLDEPGIRLEEQIEADRKILPTDKKSPAYAAAKAKIAEQEAKLAEHNKAVAPRMQEIYDEAGGKLVELGKQNRNIGIALAVDGNKAILPHLSEDDKKIVDITRQLYDKYKERLQAQGHEVISKNYGRHLFLDNLPGGDTNPLISAFNKGGSNYANGIWWSRATKLDDAAQRFVRRQSDFNWFPAWSQSLTNYIPATERKLAMTPYVNKWVHEAAGWTQAPRLQGALKGFFDRVFSAGATSKRDSAFNHLIDAGYAFKLFGNMSVPILHSFKYEQLLAARPAETLLATGDYSKAIADKLAGVQGPQRQALETFVHLKSLMKTVEQHASEEWMGSKFWKNVTRVGTGPTALVEHFENGVNVLGTLRRAARQASETGQMMDPIDITNEVIDNIHQMSFRGYDAPAWMTGSSMGRTVGMFMQQPYNLVSTKADWLSKSLRGEADAFGDKAWAKTARLITMLGMTFTAGAAAGVDLSKQLFHLPGDLYGIARNVYFGGKYGGWGGAANAVWHANPSFASPPISLAQEMQKKGIGPALSSFASAPAVDNFIRLMGSAQTSPKFGQGDQKPLSGPAIRQFLGIPKIGWDEEQFQKEQWLAAKHAKKQMLTDLYTTTPFGKEIRGDVQRLKDWYWSGDRKE